jgi:hypothetical protein
MKVKNIIIASIVSVTAVAMAAIGAVIYVNKSIDKIELNKLTEDAE